METGANLTAKQPQRGIVSMPDITPTRYSTSMRARTTESSQWEAQQKSVLADVEAHLSLLLGEKASLEHQIGDLQDVANAIRQGLIVLEERRQ